MRIYKYTLIVLTILYIGLAGRALEQQQKAILAENLHNEQLQIVAEQDIQIQTLTQRCQELYQQTTKQDDLLQTITQTQKADWKVSSAVATAYSPFDNVSGIEAEGTGARTSIGLIPGPHVIAVDPSRIPYGSQMLLIYPDGSRLEGIAGDTGGALRDADYLLLDVFKSTYKEACQHGRKDVVLLWRATK